MITNGGPAGLPRRAERRLSTQAYLFGLVAAVLVPLLAFAAFLLTHYTVTERTRFESEATRIARQVALVIDGELGGLVALLKGLRASSALTTNELGQFHEEAKRLIAGMDAIVVLRDLGSGQLLNTERPFGTVLPPAVPLSPAHRATFAADRPVVSEVYASPLTGEARIAVAIPVMRDGELTYVLAITVPTTRIRDALLPAVPTGWIVGVGDREGTYVSRSARHEDVTGKPVLPEYLAKAVDRSGTFTSLSLEAIPLLVGYYRSEFSSWLFGANIPQSAVEAPLWQSVTVFGSLGTAALILSALLAYLFGRGFTAATTGIAERAAALGKGLPLPPMHSRLAEFAVVSDALASAAVAVDERARERERTLEREALLGSIFDAAGVHVAVVELLETDYVVVLANRAASVLFGRAECRIEGCRASELGFDVQERRFWLELCHRCDSAGTPVTTEYQFTRGGIASGWLLSTFRLLPATAPGWRTRVAFTAVDISDRRRAEQALRERTRELETVLATVPVAVWFSYDLELRQVTSNRFATELMREPDVEGRSFRAHAPPLDHVQFLKNGLVVAPNEMPLRRAMGGERISDEESTLSFVNGANRTLLTSATALRDDEGAILGAVSVSLDITGRKRVEEQLRLVINELNHRVKNMLTTVQSIVVHTLRGATSVEEARTTLIERLIALGKVHDVLTHERWEGAGLRDIVDGVISPDAWGNRFMSSGPPVWLTPALSLSLALALHELATNAAKYGALSTESGNVDISWEILDPFGDAQLILRWVERGGPRVRPPTRRGFGSLLIERSLSSEGGTGTIDYSGEGLLCVMETPIRRRVSNPGSIKNHLPNAPARA